MKKITVKLLALLLVSLLLVWIDSAFAESASVNAISGNQAYASATLSGNSLNCRGEVVLLQGFKADITVYLQQKNDSGQWKVITSRYKESAEEVAFDYNISSGTYRVKIFATIYNNGKRVDSATGYSPIVTR